MFKIKSDCEYGDAIRNFMQSQFPLQSVKGCEDVLDLVTSAIVATGKVRLGPKPSIESLYLIRQHLQKQLKAGEPIRFLMPWGSEKPVDLQTVDIAELCAIKTISELNARVQTFYTPGIDVRIRVEDGTAPNLFHTDRDRARMNAKVYSDSLEALVNVLEVPFIQTVRETRMITEAKFEKEFQQIYPAMLDYIQGSQHLVDHEHPDDVLKALPEYKALADLGWSGAIPQAQREHYRGTYRRLYDMNDDEATETLARYLSQSLARKRLGVLGNLEWEDYIGLSFVGPIPGEPKNLSARRVFYRTIPENISGLHMPPWRAKGYLSIGNNGAKPRLASWAENRSYVSNVMELEGTNGSVSVRCDYEVKLVMNVAAALYHRLRRHVGLIGQDPDIYVPPLRAVPLIILIYVWERVNWRMLFDCVCFAIIATAILVTCASTLAWTSIWRGWGW